MLATIFAIISKMGFGMSDAATAASDCSAAAVMFCVVRGVGVISFFEVVSFCLIGSEIIFMIDGSGIGVVMIVIDTGVVVAIITVEVAAAIVVVETVLFCDICTVLFSGFEKDDRSDDQGRLSIAVIA